MTEKLLTGTLSLNTTNQPTHDLYALTCELLLLLMSTIIIVCKQLSCVSVKDNGLFLSIFTAATAIHSFIVKEEIKNYCQQMERQNNNL